MLKRKRINIPKGSTVKFDFNKKRACIYSVTGESISSISLSFLDSDDMLDSYNSFKDYAKNKDITLIS